MSLVHRFLIVAGLALIATPAFSASAEAQRAKILETRAEVLTRLYEEKPQARGEISNAEGYAVFSNLGVNLFFIAAGGGRGVVHDNRSGKDTYMNMGSAGVGIGLGIKDFRGIFIFHTRKALTDFIEKGWDFTGQADAAAKSTDKGGEENIAGTTINGVTLYQLTETGLALQATLQGTRYWKSAKLN